MIIGNNNPGNHFQNQVKTNSSNNSFGNNSFQNRWNTIQQQNQNIPMRKNVFVQDIKEQKYSNSADTHGMQDRTLAMLHERLENGTITMEEFNRKCMQLGRQREIMSKNNKLF